MFSMKTKWVKFFSSESQMKTDIGKRDSLPIVVNGKNLILLKSQEEYHLILSKCPHQGLSLREAHCENGNVVCPHHQYHFSLETGRGHGLYLERYPIEIREDGVYAGFEYFSIF